MNALNNSVNLIGNLGRDVELLTFKNGNCKANVTLATSSYFKNTKGEFQKETQWHQITAWGDQANNMAKVLKKGASVVLNGKLAYKIFTDKNGLEKRVAEVVVDNFMLVQKDKSEQKAMASAEFEEALPF